MINDDILDILETIDHSSASSYQKISDFCQNLMKVEIHSAIDGAPESIQNVIENVFLDFSNAMQNFCKTESYFMTHPSTWSEFYQAIKPPIDEACEALLKETQKKRFSQSQKTIVEKSIGLIEVLQDGQEFFENQADEVEEEANSLRSKLETLLKEADAVKHLLQDYPSLQQDSSIQERCSVIEENCRNVIQTCGSIYKRSIPQEIHPPLSAAFVSTTQEQLEGFNQHLRLDLSFLSPQPSSKEPQTRHEGAAWYLNRLKEFLPDIEENTKKGREVFQLLLQGIQQEFDEALATLHRIAGKSSSEEKESYQEAMIYHILDNLALYDLTKKEFKQQAHLIGKRFVEDANRIADHHEKYQAHQG